METIAVTVDHSVDELCAEFDVEHDDYNSIILEALVDRKLRNEARK